jgi:hypothetical protein
VPGGYQTYKTSFIGATGFAAEYTFPACISAIPKCSDIRDYTLVDTSPVGAAYIYDELVAKFDVSMPRIITFRI